MERAAPLETIAVRHADLEAAGREWLQRLFGRPLRDDEDVTIVVSAAHAAAPISDRRAAFQSVERILDRAARNMSDISDEKFEDAADEAMKHVRPTFER
jgi:hypothetical protein